MKLIGVITNRITKTTHAYIEGKTLCPYLPFPEEKMKVFFSATNHITCKRCLKKIPSGIYKE